MTDLITQAIECLRKNGEPLLADTVHELVVRADSLALQLAAAMELARGISADVRALMGGNDGDSPR